jgi:hypothetical protein
MEMGPGEVMIAFIVIGLPVTVLFALVSRTMRYREKKLELQTRIAEAEAAKDGARGNVSKLEERVRVLERIVTDRGMDIAHEIEQLRDPVPALEKKVRKPARARAKAQA